MNPLEVVASGGEAWDSFFEYLTSGAAAILGLAFVAFQVRRKHWRRHPLRQPIAVMTLTELATPLFFGLVYLKPDHPWQVAGFIVAGGGYLAMAWYVVQCLRFRRAVGRFERAQLLGVVVSAVTFSFIGFAPTLEIKASFLIWMIFSGLFEAWAALGTARPTPMRGTERQGT